MSYSQQGVGFTGKQIGWLIFGILFLMMVPILVFNLIENLDAGHVMVIQSPISGDLAWYTSPGPKPQFFGKVTKYQKRSQLWFSGKSDQGAEKDESIKIRFNDGGHANISGGISWEIPLDDEHLTMLHTKFGSHLAVEQQLVKTIVEKAVYMTGPLMSSTESYASRRNELLNLIEDQIQNGICLTKTTQQLQKDPITGDQKAVAVVELVTLADGKPKRAELSPLTEFKVKTFNLSINEVKYDGDVEKQIQQQQQATMQVQIAIAEAKKAEQQALTARKEGEANAAKAEWEQKTIAARLTTEADMKKKVAETEAAQKLAVAELDAKAAEQKKKAEIALGEGESKRRQLVMEADGALEKKLAAWISVNQNYAEALSKYQGQWVPSIVMAGGGGNGVGIGQVQSTSAWDLIQLLTAKTAKDLAVDMNFMSKAPSAAKTASTQRGW